MWCPKPKAKVIPRPKPNFPHQRAHLVLKSNGDDSKIDPHRDARRFGVKHTDVTRAFLVEDRTCHVPTRPFGVRKTDITRYLERAIPHRADEASDTHGTNPRSHGKRQNSDIRACFPDGPWTHWETRDCRTRENIRPEALPNTRPATALSVRPDTAPTGEMRRLSAASSSTLKTSSRPTSTAFPRRALTAGSLRPDSARALTTSYSSKPGSVGALTTSSCKPELAHGSNSGSVLNDESGSESRCMTSTTHTSASRLQSVPE